MLAAFVLSLLAYSYFAYPPSSRPLERRMLTGEIRTWTPSMVVDALMTAQRLSE